MIQHTPFRSLLCIFVLFLFFSGEKDRNPSGGSEAKAQDAPAQISPKDWSSIRAAYEAGRHKAFPVDGGYRMHNPGQQWSTQFDGRGFVTTPNASTWSWGLEFRSYGIGADQKTVGNKANISAEGQSVSYNWDDTLTEWYKNDTRGFEHGFTVWNRPSDVAGLLTLTLGVTGDLQPRVLPSSRDVAFVNKDGVSVLNYSNLTAFDSRGKKLPAHFELCADELCISVDDSGAQYPITIDPIAQQAYLKASNTEVSDQFGQSVAVSGDTVVVGAWVEDSSATGVNGDQSNNSANASGAAYVFVRSSTGWTQQAYLKASNTEAEDRFGHCVAIAGNTIVVSAPAEGSDATGVNGDQSNNNNLESGAAYVFVRSGTSWTQQAYLKASNTNAQDLFGVSVSISGDTVVVGADLEDSNATGVNGDQSNNSASNSGAAYVFVRSGTSWTQQSYLKASNAEINDLFGFSVAISGDTVVVGAMSEASAASGINGNQSDNSIVDAGAAYVFARVGTAWSQQSYLKASNVDSDDLFGRAVAISGDTVVVGALWEDSAATGVNGDQSDNSVSNAGAVYVYSRSGNTWSQQAYLKGSDNGADDRFGYSVAVSNDTIVVGTLWEDSAATGINGNQNDNSSTNAGAAYVFVRNGASWVAHSYLKASNTGSGDNFGYSVAVSGDVVVVGARSEDSSATGVNGNALDNSALGAGAAYIFDLDNNPGTLSYGTGTPGCAGIHTLDVTHALMINSPNFAITCSNAPPFSMGLGIVTDSQDLPGTDAFGVGVLIHSDFIFATEILTFDFFSDGTGYSETVGTGIPNNPLLIGQTFYASALWAWSPSTCVLPGFNPYNLSTSRGLAITILAP